MGVAGPRRPSDAGQGYREPVRGLDMTERLNIPRYKRWRLPEWADRALSIAVLEDDDQETIRTKRLMTGAVWFALTNPWPVFFVFIAAGAPLAAWVVFGSFLSAVIVLVVLWLRPASFPGVFHFLLLANFGVSVALTLLFGGFLESGINFIWAIVLVFGGLVVFGDWRAGAWLAFGMAAFIASSFGTRFVEPLYELPDPGVSAVFTFLIVLVFVSFVLWYYIRQRAELLELSDGLLDNILPEAIADRLKV